MLSCAGGPEGRRRRPSTLGQPARTAQIDESPIRRTRNAGVPLRRVPPAGSPVETEQ